MKTLTKFRWTIGMVSMLVSLCVQAYPGESIVLDPVTGDYTITYWDEVYYGDEPTGPPAGLSQTIFVPATKIIPAIRSKFRLVGASDVAYSYTISNGAAAKQAIVGLSLEQTARVKGERDFPAVTAAADEVEQAIFANMSALDSPEGWGGNTYSVRGYSRIVWRSDELETGGVKAGRTQPGFGFSSPALPGLSEARMDGIGEILGMRAKARRKTAPSCPSWTGSGKTISLPGPSPSPPSPSPPPSTPP